jgi:hypothetical protein
MTGDLEQVLELQTVKAKKKLYFKLGGGKKQRTPKSCLYHRLNRELEERGEQLDRLLEERGELTKRLEDLETRDREQVKVRLCWEDW